MDGNVNVGKEGGLLRSLRKHNTFLIISKLVASQVPVEMILHYNTSNNTGRHSCVVFCPHWPIVTFPFPNPWCMGNSS